MIQRLDPAGCCGACFCGDCCTDALPDSLDVTFPSGWSDPTLDLGKIGCNTAYTPTCAPKLDGQTFNLSPISQGLSGACSLFQGAIVQAPPCAYIYTDSSFCYSEPSGNVIAQAIWAWFECDNNICTLRAQMELCVGLLGVGSALSVYKWASSTYSPLACSGLSKTANWVSLTNYYLADSEGICVPPGSSVLVEDGG